MTPSRLLRRLLGLLGFLLVLVVTVWLRPQDTAAPSATPRPPTPTRAASVPDAPPVASALALYVQPAAGRKPLLDAVRGAERTLEVAVYLLTDPDVIESLKDAAQRGVAVRLLLEREPYGGNEGIAELADELRAAGVQVQWDVPTLNYLHQKSVVADGEVAFILTHNLTRSSFSRNREYGIITRDPVHVAEIGRVFDADWQRQGIDLAQSALVWSPANGRQRLLALIDGAHTTIDAQQSALQDADIIRHLQQAARRGVRVRLLMTPDPVLEDDINEPGRAQLREAGGAVRYLVEPYIHAKMFIFDGHTGFIGSQNMTANSLDFNRELGIAFTDAEAVRQLAAQFTLDWQLATDDAAPEDDTGGVVPHGDAARYIGQTVTVELTVNAVYDSGRVLWLMPDEERDSNFKVVIFPGDYEAFADRPDRLFRGRRIRVTGEVVEFRGAPEIVVDGPQQIEVVP